MPSPHLSLDCHLVFSTKDRCPWIGKEWRGRLHAYLGGAVKACNGIPQQAGGVDIERQEEHHRKICLFGAAQAKRGGVRRAFPVLKRRFRHPSRAHILFGPFPVAAAAERLDHRLISKAPPEPMLPGMLTKKQKQAVCLCRFMQT